jgi:hypothetical protein
MFTGCEAATDPSGVVIVGEADAVAGGVAVMAGAGERVSRGVGETILED